MTKNWEKRSFEDCLQKIVYSKKIQRKDFLEKGEYPIISQEQDFINGYWNNSEDLFIIEKPIVIFGDHTQVIKYVDFDFVLGADGVKILQSINEIDPRYFFYYLHNISLGSLGYARHYRLLKEIEVNFPNSLPEQKRIVAILDKAFAAIDKSIANTQKNLQNTKDLFDSYLNEIFSNPGDDWEKHRLCDICVIKPPKSEARNKLIKTDIVSFAPMKDLGINKKFLIPSKERSLKEVEGSYTYFSDDDVLMAKITPCFENGKLGIAKNLKNNIGFGSSEYIVFRTNKNLFSEYLYYFLLQSKFRKEGARRMMGAVGHKRVSKEFIMDYIIFVPSFILQKSIVSKIDSLSSETKRLEAIYQQKLDNLKELKQSILQKAFEGEL